MPLVTVFIPVFNTEKYIDQAIESVINQQFSDWELVILDDCSTDNSYSICLSHAAKDKRISVFRNDTNLGMMPNWNKGIPLCKNEYWAKLDADDYWDPLMLSNCVKILEQDKNVGLVCGKYITLADNQDYSNDEELPEFASDKKFSCLDLVKSGPSQLFKYDVLRQGIGLMRRKLFDELGPFLLLDSGDTEMWYRIGCHYDIYCCNQILHYHRIWSESFMRKNTDTNELRSSKKFFDTKNAIFDYYRQQGKIDQTEYKKFKNETKFHYNSFLISKNRKEFNYFKMFQHLFQNFFIDPKMTFAKNLHVKLFSKE